MFKFINKNWINYLLLMSVLIGCLSAIVKADDYVPHDIDDEGTTAEIFILDNNDTLSSSGEVVLQFGNTLNKYLRYNLTLDVFELNADLSLEDNELKSFRIENLVSAPTCDALVKGKEYYNTTDNKVYVCNGALWEQLLVNAVAINLPAVQVRRSTIFTIPASFGDVPFDQTDIENNATVLEHDNTNTDRITIKTSGVYRVTYVVNLGLASSSTAEVDTRIRVNDTTVLNGSMGRSTTFNAGGTYYSNSHIGQTFLASFLANDYISLQMQYDNQAVDALENITVTVVKLDGVKGEKGDTGVAGSLDQDYDFGGNGLGKTIIVDSGAVELDATTFSNAPLELTPLSTAPTTDLNGGQLYYDDEGILYSFDPTRSKWLSVQRLMMGFGRNSSNTTNEYLRQLNGASSATNGWRMPRDGTITAISAQTNNSETWTYQIRKNDSATAIVSLTMNNTTGGHLNNINIDFNEGDYIQAYCQGSSISYPEGLFEFSWRP